MFVSSFFSLISFLPVSFRSGSYLVCLPLPVPPVFPLSLFVLSALLRSSLMLVVSARVFFAFGWHYRLRASHIFSDLTIVSLSCVPVLSARASSPCSRRYYLSISLFIPLFLVLIVLSLRVYVSCS